MAVSAQHTALDLRPTRTAGRSRSARTFGASASRAWGPEDAAVRGEREGIPPIPFAGQLRQLQHELENRPLHEVE